MGNENSAEKILASGWDDVARAAASSGAYLKWEPGQIHNLNVCGAPVFYEKTFKPEEGPKRRVRIEAFVPGEGLKTWEMAPGTLRDLMEERSDGKVDFGNALFAVKRIGSGKDTVYKMRFQRPLSAAEMAERKVAQDMSVTSSNGPAANDGMDASPF